LPTWQRISLYCLLPFGGALVGISGAFDGLRSVSERLGRREAAFISIALFLVAVLMIAAVKRFKPAWLLKGGEQPVRISALRLVFPSIVVASITVALSPFWFNWVFPSDAGQATKGRNEVLSDLQARELRELAKRIAHKGEIELRETFDFVGMLKYNIATIRRSLSQTSVPPEMFHMTLFYEGGLQRIDKTFIKADHVNNRVVLTPIPGKFGVLHLSPTHIASRTLLTHYISSSELPTNVIDGLKRLDGAVDTNLTRMIESLNASLSEDRRNILLNDDPSSNWVGSATGRYWSHFIQLEPHAKDVNAEIRSALGVR